MQIALLDGEPIIAFDLSEAEFEAVRVRYRRDPSCLKLPDGTPAVPRRTKAVSAHFAHKAGFTGTTKPETIHHVRAKQIIRDVARAAGWEVEIEARHPDGDWVADVLISREERRIAFEVQWSTQTIKEYERRTGRYAADGIETVWLANARNAWWAVKRAAKTIPLLPDSMVGDVFDDPIPLRDVIGRVLEAMEVPPIPEAAPKLQATDCYRCGKTFIFKPLHTLWGDKEPFTPEQLDWLRGRGATVRRNYSRVVKRQYPAWHCPHCRAMQGDSHLGRGARDVTVHDGRLVDDRRGVPFWDVVSLGLGRAPYF